MQKTRRLVDSNSAFFQMLLIQLYFIAIGSESQISVDQVTLYSKQCQRNTQIFVGGGGGEHAQKPNFQ